ncbi:unnamed protein product [Nyctereutes procyonoides]|uniref:Interleukin-1 alpha n=1 Tax=Nyctereutes procyonoides TaxID=34880 RepID=A0A811YJZ8_NYCPR|nr:unnamed protein product [Nyctereutes procyonoides]
MAKVPDLFEDLKNCYSENEEYSSEIDHLSLNQKSFYDMSCDPLHKDCMSLSTSEISKTSQLTFKESVVVVAANGKILKKRRLSLSQFITNDDLEDIANDTEEVIMKPRSVAYNFHNNEKYNYIRIIKSQFILNDNLNQSIVRQTGGNYLMTAALQNLDDAVKFDMGAYTSEDSKLPVTLRISKTRLFVSAQNEDEPVLLKVSGSQSPIYLHLHPMFVNDSNRQIPLAGWHSPFPFLTQFLPAHLAPNATSHLSPEALLGRIYEKVKWRWQE